MFTLIYVSSVRVYIGFYLGPIESCCRSLPSFKTFNPTITNPTAAKIIIIPIHGVIDGRNARNWALFKPETKTFPLNADSAEL